MDPPTVPEVSVPIVSGDHLKRLLKTTEGKSMIAFEQRRDAAILRVFHDCGVRSRRVDRPEGPLPTIGQGLWDGTRRLRVGQRFGLGFRSALTASPNVSEWTAVGRPIAFCPLDPPGDSNGRHG
jgi:hypothetical protein